MLHAGQARKPLLAPHLVKIQVEEITDHPGELRIKARHLPPMAITSRGTPGDLHQCAERGVIASIALLFLL